VRTVLLVDHDDHDDADFTIGARQRRAVYPTRFPADHVQIRGDDAGAVVGRVDVVPCAWARSACQPGDLCCDADALRKGFDERVTDMFGAADVVFKFGLAESGDTE